MHSSSTLKRVFFALILVIGHLTLTVHAMEAHDGNNFAQCELCVAQANGNAALPVADYPQCEVGVYHEHIHSPALTQVSAEHYPAWTQRGPPEYI